MSEASSRMLLLVSGTLLLVVGGGVLLQPAVSLAVGGSAHEVGASVMSELRAPGVFLLASSVLVLAGAKQPRCQQRALGLSALVYGGFGASRLVALAIDGIPSSGILWAIGVELLIGGLSFVAVVYPSSSKTRRSFA